MGGRIFITSAGYDPEQGKHVKDPYLGPVPSLGACRPDVRKAIERGDWLFFVSGKLRRGPAQYVMGGFQVEQKMGAREARLQFPAQCLRKREDGQLDGNIIVDPSGDQDPLDTHGPRGFESRIENYLVGAHAVQPVTPDEIAQCRLHTLDMLRRLFDNDGTSPFQIIGRGARKLSEAQVASMLDWLYALKESAAQRERLTG